MKHRILAGLYFTFSFILLLFVSLASKADLGDISGTVDFRAEDIVLCDDGKLYALICPTGASEVPSNAPVLFFSDLTSGPDTGWSAAEPNRGVAVTVWGRNFGSPRGTSHLTVNGIELTSNDDYMDGWGDYDDPIPWLQRVTFRLKSTMTDGAGTIMVTTSEGTSNTLPFTIRSGRILFVDASVAEGSGTGTILDPMSPYDIFDQEQVGDTYYFRGGTYDQKYEGNGSGNFYISYAGMDATAANPIALVGYPGEIAMFDTYSNSAGSSSNRYAFYTVPDHYVISRLHTNCYGECIRVDSYNRVIGNTIEGQKAYVQGSGHIVTQHSGSVVMGNAVFGARIGASGNDHAIYAQGCPDEEGVTIAYNYLYDNDLYNDALIVLNHQQSRCSNSQQVKSHYVHSNIINCANYGGRGIGVYDLSWDDASVPGSNGQDTAGEPEPAYIYNNVTYRCGDYPSNPNGYGPSMYTNAAHSKWFNNLILESNDDLGFHADGGRLISTEFRNNIVTMQDSNDRPVVHRSNGRDTFTASHNLYWNANTGSASTSYGSLALGTNYVEADPLVTLQFSPSFELSIGSGSPALGAGTSVSVVVEDFFKNSLLTPRTIGPVETVQ